MVYHGFSTILFSSILMRNRIFDRPATGQMTCALTKTWMQ